MRTQLNNQISAPVLEVNGRKIDEREFVNTPFAHLFPADEFVVIDWLANSTTERPEEAELRQPVTYNGKQWQGSWAWGSAVKTGQTVGLLRDIGYECRMIKNAEDGQRFNRWLLARGSWGGAVHEFLHEYTNKMVTAVRSLIVSSLFIAFPEASRWIVTEKPGLKNAGLATILTGCNYQVPGLEELETEVEVVDVTTEKNGKRWMRKAIFGTVDGQLAPQNSMYPENMIGLIAVNADQPEKGAYFARIRKVSSGAWQCVLVRA